MQIVFFSDIIPFNGGSVYTRPLGGLESALIYMARELAYIGHSVTVFNECDSAGKYDCVDYRHIDTFCSWDQKDSVDIAILCRTFKPLSFKFCPKLVIYWTGDAYDQPYVQPLRNASVINAVDYIFLLSDWQKTTFINNLGVSEEKIWLTRNGFNPEFFENKEYDRNPYRLIYTSTPYRGLDVLLSIFPLIKTIIPRAELHVFSSMKVYNYTNDLDRQLFSNLYEQGKQEGVSLHGSIVQKDLAGELLKSRLMVYTNHFDETSCIAAIEAQAAGVPVVTSARAALRETVVHGKTGLLVDGDSRSESYIKDFITSVAMLLRNEQLCDLLSSNARNRTFKMYKWKIIAIQWNNFFIDQLRTPQRRYFLSLLQENRLDELREDLEKQSVEDNYSKDRATMLGIIYSKQGEKNKAESMFKIILDKNPEDTETLCNLGVHYHLNNDRLNALRVFRYALSIDQNCKIALSHIAQFCE